MNLLFERIERIIEFLNTYLKKNTEKFPDLTELYPLGLRLNIRVKDGEKYYLAITPERSFIKKGTSAVDLNLEAPESFWLEAFAGKYSIISGVMTKEVKVRGLRSSFMPLILFSSIISLCSTIVR
jgi:putative sterol carrier protein